MTQIIIAGLIEFFLLGFVIGNEYQKRKWENYKTWYKAHIEMLETVIKDRNNQIDLWKEKFERWNKLLKMCESALIKQTNEQGKLLHREIVHVHTGSRPGEHHRPPVAKRPKPQGG